MRIDRRSGRDNENCAPTDSRISRTPVGDQPSRSRVRMMTSGAKPGDAIRAVARCYVADHTAVSVLPNGRLQSIFERMERLSMVCSSAWSDSALTRRSSTRSGRRDERHDHGLGCSRGSSPSISRHTGDEVHSRLACAENGIV